VRGNVVVLLMLGGGIFFTIFSVTAWTMGRRAGSMLLAVMAGVDFAFAISLLLRADG
jgi:hypothetical protein